MNHTDSVFDVGTTPRDGRPRNRSSIPRKGKAIFSTPNGPEEKRGPRSLLFSAYRELFPVGKSVGAWRWPFTFILVPRLWVSGAVPHSTRLLCHYGIKTWPIDSLGFSLPSGYNVIYGETFLANPATEITCKIRFVTVPIVAGSWWREEWGD